MRRSIQNYTAALSCSSSPLGHFRAYRKAVSLFLIFTFSIVDFGCSYYKIASKAERTSSTNPVTTIDPAVVIPQLKESQNVIIQFRNGSRISRTYRFSDGQSIYVGQKKKVIDQTIPIDSIEAIKPVDPVDARMYSIAKQGGDTLFTVPEFKKGSYIRILLTDGTALNEFYLRRDKENIYVRNGSANRERPIALKTISYARLASEKKYLILHYRGQPYHLRYASLNKKQTELSGIIEPVPEDHQYYRFAKEKGSTRYAPNKGHPNDEVHLYTAEMNRLDDSHVVIPVRAIDKIEYYGPDSGRTSGEAVLATIGVLAILIIIVAATKKSCPFVYTYNGQAYAFEGEIYGGAIYPNLERDDFLPMPGFRPFNDQYRLKISNYLHEVQHTNLADLLVFEHPDSVRVLLDKRGVPQTIHSPQPPMTATSGTGTDQGSRLSAMDNESYLFDDGTLDRPDVSSLELTFKRPASATRGKLVLKATNSYWLDYLYGKFNEEFGTYYPRFVEKQGKEPAEKLNAWSMDQHIPLAVSLKTAKGWTTVDYFHVMGPLASRELVMPIDLGQVEGDTLTIKLEAGFLFWEVDYAAMDFSQNSPTSLKRLHPATAVDELGHDVTATLMNKDNDYLVQPEVGNEATITYNFTGDTTRRQTVFLHSSGYYQSTVRFTNKPNWLKLYSFRKKGSFSKYSLTQYAEFKKNQSITSAGTNSQTKTIQP